MGPAQRRDDRHSLQQLRLGDRLGPPPVGIVRIAAQPFPGEPGDVDAHQGAIGRALPPVWAAVSASPHRGIGFGRPDRNIGNSAAGYEEICTIPTGRISSFPYRYVRCGD